RVVKSCSGARSWFLVRGPRGRFVVRGPRGRSVGHHNLDKAQTERLTHIRWLAIATCRSACRPRIRSREQRTATFEQGGCERVFQRNFETDAIGKGFVVAERGDSAYRILEAEPPLVVRPDGGLPGGRQTY